MQHPVIDLRSDTITKPTKDMLQAMMEAEVGDDVYGEDSAVNSLERRVATLLGKEAALFVPSGTMANQIAINLHCRPGDSIITEEDSHCFLYEAGAAAAMTGVQFDLIPASSRLSADSVEKKYRGEDLHSAASSLLIVENTHNRGGGTAKSFEMLKPAVDAAKALKLATHCDGARLWNAAVATGQPEKQLASGFDSIAVCFSKGLGAPVGSALCGSREFIERARKVRKRWGGGMRQAGYLAAAATYAIDHHRSRLVDDHRRAAEFKRSLLEGVRNQDAIDIPEINFPTNMVYFRTPSIAGGSFNSLLKEQGILLSHLGNNVFRAVFHLHVDDPALNRLSKIAVDLLNR